MPRTLTSLPSRDGYRMPGEFEPHAGCWMLWPERPDNWRLGAKPAQAAFAAVATAIARSEPVTVGVSAGQFNHARSVLPPRIRVDGMFNAWGGHEGGLYRAWNLDDVVAKKVLEIENRDRYFAPFVLEGGAIHVDGQGTLITTEECLLNPNRNPKLTRTDLEQLLARYVGIEHVIWLGRGVIDDETSGHVDNLCCFVRPGDVALTWTSNRRDPQYEVSRDAWERLHAARDARGRRLRVHKLEQPGPLKMTQREAADIDPSGEFVSRRAGMRLAGSYVNFYIGNRCVVVPLLDPRRDDAALRKIRSLFPRREVVGVPAREILLGGGNIHCITQQVPLGRGARRRPAGGG